MTCAQQEVSVVICAYTEERWNELVEAVASVQRQSPSAHEIVVVIDHNSRLLQRAHTHISGVTLVESQEQPGLSGARNCGIEATQGSLILFMDDDAIAEPGWLQSLTQACEDPRILGSGGLAEPAWRGNKPRWLPEEFYWVVGCSYKGLPETRDAVRNPIGASMCIRREVFDAVGGFRSDIGRSGTRPAGCEETELCVRAQQHWPHRFFLYEPKARIRHGVAASRTSWGYFCSRCFHEGRSKALVTRLVGARGALASEHSYAIQTLPKGVIRGIADAIIRRDVRGLARAAAIVAGLAITTAGYASGLCMQRPAMRPGRGRPLLARWRVPGGAMLSHPQPAIGRDLGARDGS